MFDGNKFSPAFLKEVLTMKRFLTTMILAAASMVLNAEEVRLTVETNKVVHRIDEKIYGHFFENIFHSADNGVWGELIWNRSFEYNLGGSWTFEKGVLSQKSRNTNVIHLIGNSDLSDFQFSFEAKKTGGEEGFLIPFHYQNEKEFQWVNLGGWGNKRHAFERKLKSEERQHIVGKTIDNVSIEKDRWYQIVLRCEGKKATLSIDGNVVLENDDAENFTSGKLGVGTWATQAEFRNFQITKLDGTKVNLNPSPVVKIPHWNVYGGANIALKTDDSLNDQWSVEISVQEEGGIVQDGFCFRKGETYQGSIWASGQINSLIVSVPEMTENAIKRNGQRRTKVVGNKTWTQIPIEFTAKEEKKNASLKIGFSNGGDVLIDQVSLMPKSWIDNYGGMRPELVEALGALKPPVMRLPGGCYASIYRWKDGIGAQENRKSSIREIWDDKDPNSFGTDEFMKLCERLKIEPIVVVNLGSQPWYPANQDRAEFIQDVFDWIEYCNGSADSKWGKIRAANGHREPYNVKYWELDNETWGWKVENYAAAVNEIAPMIKKKYPELKLIVCGSGSYDYNWNKYIIEHCAENFDYLSIHHYESPDKFDTGARDYEAFIARHRELIAQSKNPNLKIDCSEWNAQSVDWRTGLYCGGILNGFERLGDIFEIGGPALLFRHSYANSWDNAFINFNNESWFPGANYVVMKLYREHYAPNLLLLLGEQKGLNCTATKSEDGKNVILKFVNPTKEEREAIVTLNDFQPTGATFQLLQSDNLRLKNSFAEPNLISPKPAAVKIDGTTIRFTLPQQSVGVVKIAK